MKSYLLILTFFLFNACFSQRVNLFVESWKPYCGGAKPTPEVERGIRTPFSGEKIAAFRRNYENSNPPVLVKWLQLDEEGKWEGCLKPGIYDFYRSEKILSLDEIEKKHRFKDNENYAFIGIEKLNKWKTTPDYTIEIKKKTELKITLIEKCFVGLNPCMEYIGPNPK